MTCPLCEGTEVALFAEREGRSYHRCATCALTFMDPAHRLSEAEELARYETHDNRPDDPGYRSFLERLAIPLQARLPAGARGLDYGSGPGPTLSILMEEAGFPSRCWDPFFAPDPAPLSDVYDFVTCTETVEHFYHPGAEFRRLASILRPGGWLGVMTGILHSDLEFANWWYVRDPSHVAFYAPETLEWIAWARQWEMEIVAPTVVLFRIRA